jgi:hypothetical protein
MAERAPAQQTTPTKRPVVEKVMYGVGKFVERHTPTAHADRIITAINRFIIPKLSPEKRQWVGKHKDAIETAAVVAGVGITATEITIATVFTVRMLGRFREVMERIKARQAATRPIDVSTSNRDKLKAVAESRKPKGKSIVPEKAIPVVYDRTNELFMIQELSEDPNWQDIPTVRAFLDGTLQLRDNEVVDWARLGLPDPNKAKPKMKVRKGKIRPHVPPVDSYAARTVTAVAEQTAQQPRGIGDAIRDKLREIWPWSLENQILRAHRKRIATTKALGEKRAQDAARAAQQKIWDEERARMLLKRTQEMERDHQERLQQGIQKGIAERLRLEKLATVIRRGSVIDAELAKKSPDLVAAIAEKAATLPTNETTITKNLTELLVGIEKHPETFAPLVEKVAAAGDGTDALRAASELLERAYNSQKGVKKIDRMYTTKFTTMASFWLQRLGQVGLDLLRKK